jgi:hypothetical protein
LGVFLLCLITFRGEDLEGFVGDEGLRWVEAVFKIPLRHRPNYLVRGAL